MKNTKIRTLACLAIAIPALSGCANVAKFVQDDINKTLGKYEQEGPTTSRVAPLVVPPDFALEPAPTAAVRSDAQEQTLDALFGGAAPRSTAERALGSGSSEFGIRSTVGDPKTITVNKGSITRDIVAAPEGDGQYAQAVAGPN